MNQTTIYEFMYDKFIIDKPVRLIELFAGIGSQAKALKNLGVNFEHYKVIEFDKHAMASYNAVHGTNFETSDIKNIHAEDLEIVERGGYCYILTYSFPCQDLSIAGKLRGMKKGSGTRSGLLWEVERILDECNGNLPHVLIMENVPQVIGKKNIQDFQLWRKKLEELGYSSYVQLLNAKDYGIPQNRNRAFMVSLLGKYNYTFPPKIKLKKKLKDLLENNVDEKYYLTKRQIETFNNNNNNQHAKGNSFSFKPKSLKEEVATTITTREGWRMTDNFLKIPEATKQGYKKARGGGRYLYKPTSSKKRYSTKRYDTDIKD